MPSDAARPRGQYISYKPPSRFITLTYYSSEMREYLGETLYAVSGRSGELETLFSYATKVSKPHAVTDVPSLKWEFSKFEIR